MSYDVNCNDRTITQRTVDNETPLTDKADEAGRVVASPVHNESQAKKIAKGKVKSSGMNSGIEAEAVTIGLPYLKARESVTIENVGKKFSGNWRITKITHSISNDGYKCSLSLSKNDYSSGSGSGSKGKSIGGAPKSSQGAKSNAKPAGEGKNGGNNSGSPKPSDYVVNVDKGKFVGRT